MRKKTGYLLLVISFIPWLLIPGLPFLDISVAAIATITTGMIVLAEGLFFVAILLLGKEAWDRIKQWIKNLLRLK